MIVCLLHFSSMVAFLCWKPGPCHFSPRGIVSRTRWVRELERVACKQATFKDVAPCGDARTWRHDKNWKSLKRLQSSIKSYWIWLNLGALQIPNCKLTLYWNDKYYLSILNFFLGHLKHQDLLIDVKHIVLIIWKFGNLDFPAVILYCISRLLIKAITQHYSLASLLFLLLY